MTAKIGIIGEHKPGEGRIPLTPVQIQQLHAENSDLTITVQPSKQRKFADSEFTTLGIQMPPDTSDANLVIAVKEISTDNILADQAFLYFSHTIKGQDYNMPMLQHILDVGATLIDYELISDEQNKRLVFFGRHAGLAGMVNSLWSYGERQAVLGIDTPFLKIKQAQDYADLAEIKNSLALLAPEMTSWLVGKPPIIVGITGYGNVAKGAQEILDILPIVELSPSELLACDLVDYSGKIVKVVFKESDMFRTVDSSQAFELQDYFDHPEKYQSKFSIYLDRLNILVSCIYWDTPYPRLITLEEIQSHYNNTPSLLVVGDITCDIDGAIQFNTGSTLSPDPVYVYNPSTGKREMGFKGEGVLLMAVDNLPTELPREASEAFGEALLPFIVDMGSCDYSLPFDSLNLPHQVKKAVIAHRGTLTPGFNYLEEYLKA